MSIFKSQWIVIKIKKLDEKQYLYLVFFKEYWFLHVSKKKKAKEKSLDVGYNFHCEIITASSKNIHTISNIKIKNFYIAENKRYKEIEKFLSFLSYLNKEIPSGSPHDEIFHSLEIFLSSPDQSYESFVLLQLKVSEILWILALQHNDKTLQKILNFITQKHYSEIIKLRNIPEDVLKKLESII